MLIHRFCASMSVLVVNRLPTMTIKVRGLMNSALRPRMAKNTYKDNFMTSSKIIWLGRVGGSRKANIFIKQLAVEILTEMSVGASQNFTLVADQYSRSSTVWIPWWKNSGEHLQSERMARMRTSLSGRGSGKIRLALGRAATLLETPKRSISTRRRPAPCGGE